VTVVDTDSPGLDTARHALAAGTPVVLPFPTPLPYVVTGTDAAAVNLAKGRPADQPAGVAVADFTAVTPYVALDPDTLDFARWLSADELLNLLLPVGDSGPDWLAPATSKGWLALMLGWLAPLRPLLDEHGHLYVSSANRTGGSVAVTAADADAAFGGRLLVVDGDPHRDPTVPSGSAAIVRVGPNRQVEVARSGVNDGGATGFLRELAQRWVTNGRS
jgi:tRNA A37 threonylcarbamoyladenosine synthetase subunit TsaC/SUA5/YrdC